MDAVIKSFLPIKVLRAKRGVGSFVTFDMGDWLQGEKSEKSLVSTFHLWVYLADWILLEGEAPILSSSNEDDEQYGHALSRVEGLSLVDVYKTQDKFEISFVFSEGYRLIVSGNLSLYEYEDNLFMFYAEGGEVIAYSLESGFTTNK